MEYHPIQSQPQNLSHAQSQLREKQQQKKKGNKNPDSSEDSDSDSHLVISLDPDHLPTTGHVTRVRKFAESVSWSSVMKEPWVPAPGRATSIKSKSSSAPGAPTIGIESSSQLVQVRPKTAPTNVNLNLIKSEHSSSVTASGDGNQHQINSTMTGKKSSRTSDRTKRNLSGHKLQSKDSLVDVVACLDARRQDVLRLWQQNLNNTDLVEDVETANQLAIEAAKDVDALRIALHDLQQKSTLSQNDSDSLNELRNRILIKLEMFEEKHAQIHQNLAEIGTRKEKTVAASSSSSVNNLNLAMVNQSSQTNVVVVPLQDNEPVEVETKAKAVTDESKKKHINKPETRHTTNHSKSESVPRVMSERSLIFIKNPSPKFLEEPSATASSSISTSVSEDEVNPKQQERFTTGTEKSTNVDPIALVPVPHGMTPSNVKPTPKGKAKVRFSKSPRTQTQPGTSAAASQSQQFYHLIKNPSINLSRDYASIQKSLSASATKPRHSIITTTTTSSTSSQTSDHNGSSGTSQSITSEEDFGIHLRKGQLKGTLPIPQTQSHENDDEHSDDEQLNYYRYKLQKLHKKLLEQDLKYEQLSKEFQQQKDQENETNNLESKLESSSLKTQFVQNHSLEDNELQFQKMIMEMLQSKMLLEGEYHAKAQELNTAQTEVERLSKELNDTKYQLGNFREKFGQMESKLRKYRDLKISLTKELEKTQQQLSQEQQISQQRRRDPKHKSSTVGIQTITTKSHLIFQDKIAELKRELKKEKKHVKFLKEARSSESQRMKGRAEKLIEALQESRHHNRVLMKRLQFLQTSYSHLLPAPTYKHKIPLFGFMDDDQKRVKDESLNNKADKVGIPVSDKNGLHPHRCKSRHHHRRKSNNLCVNIE